MLKKFLRGIILVASVGWVPVELQAVDADLSQKWLSYGQQLVAQRQFDKAIAAFSNAARADTHNAAAYKGLGNSYYYKRDYAQALTYYKFSCQLNPADTGLALFIPKLEAMAAQSAQEGQADQAARYYNARQYDQAVQSYQATLATNPNDAKAWQGLGNCYYAKQDKVQAVSAYKHAIQLNPQNTALQNFLARYSPESAQAAGIQVNEGDRDWFQPLWRSAVLPGWGQFYNEQPYKGGILMGTNVLLLGATVTSYLIGESAMTTYENYGLGTSTANFDSAYNTWESMADLNHICYVGFVVVYSFTLVDAIIYGKRSPTNTA